MYLFLPNSFWVSVCYVNDILDIEKIETLERLDCNSSFLNKFSNMMRGPVIGISLPTQRESRWVKDKEAMESYAKERDVNLIIENADFDPVKQISQVENLISQKIDVLIWVPLSQMISTNPDEITKVANEGMELVRKAHEKGIKVIAYDLLEKNGDEDLFVGFDNVRVGELQGRYLITKVPRGNYIVMYGDPDTGIREGSMEFIQPLVTIGSIRIVSDEVIPGWNPKVAYKVVQDALAVNNNEVDAILAPNDAIAGVTIQALNEQGLAGKVPVTGQDADLPAAKRIIEGTQLMTVLKDTSMLAKVAIDAAIKLANRETVLTDRVINNGKRDLPAIYLTPIAVDKNNIDNVLINGGYYTKKEIYGTGI